MTAGRRRGRCEAIDWQTGRQDCPNPAEWDVSAGCLHEHTFKIRSCDQHWRHTVALGDRNACPHCMRQHPSIAHRCALVVSARQLTLVSSP